MTLGEKLAAGYLSLLAAVAIIGLTKNSVSSDAGKSVFFHSNTFSWCIGIFGY
jgi:hypothetical protein